MPRPAPTTVRTVLVLLVAASILGWLPRLRRSGPIRRHIDLLQNVSPIQQFAPAAGHRTLVDLSDRFDFTVIAHRVRDDLPYLFVPVDDRALEAWLA